MDIASILDSFKSKLDHGLTATSNDRLQWYYQAANMTWVEHATPEQDARSRYPLVIGVSWALGGLVILVMGLRLIFRKQTQQILAEDIFAAFGALFAITFDALITMQTRFGLGLKLADRPHADMAHYTAWNYASRPFYCLAGGFFKLALCFTYYRLAHRTTKKLYPWIVKIVGLLMAVCTALLLFFNLFYCSPPAKIFNQALPGTCLPYAAYNYALAGIIIVLDVILFCLPVPLILGTSMNKRTKWELVIVFLLLLVTTGCSIGRMTYISEVAYGDGDSTMFNLMSGVEVNVGVIVSCMPHLQPLFKTAIRQARTRQEKSNGSRPLRSNPDFSKIKALSSSRVRRGESQQSVLGRDDSQEDAIPLKNIDDGITKTFAFSVERGEEQTPSRAYF